MRTSKLFLIIFWLLANTLTSALATTVLWTGSGDGTSWADPANWSSGAVPGQINEVIITGGTATNVVIASGNIIIQSLQCAKALTIIGGALTTTAGASTISGSISVMAGGSLGADGAGVTFTASGAAQVDSASLYASGGRGYPCPVFPVMPSEHPIMRRSKRAARGAV